MSEAMTRQGADRSGHTFRDPLPGSGDIEHAAATRSSAMPLMSSFRPRSMISAAALNDVMLAIRFIDGDPGKLLGPSRGVVSAGEVAARKMNCVGGSAKPSSSAALRGSDPAAADLGDTGAHVAGCSLDQIGTRPGTSDARVLGLQTNRSNHTRWCHASAPAAVTHHGKNLAPGIGFP